MKTTKEMIESHSLNPLCDSDRLAQAIGEMNICGQACVACADACLAEQQVKELTSCIRLNLDCADICHATSAMLSRLTSPAREGLKAAVRACATICSLCAAECARHASMHKHCLVCSEACRRCQQECESMLAVL